MTKLVQNDIASLTNEQSALAALNANYDSLETFADSVLSRDGSIPNEMEAELDMNSHRVINLPAPITNTEPLRLQDLLDFTHGTLSLTDGATRFTQLIDCPTSYVGKGGQFVKVKVNETGLDFQTSGAALSSPGPVVVDNAVVRWDGTTGLNVQNSVAILDDTGGIVGLNSIIGGSGATSTLTIKSTNNGSPTTDFVFLKGGQSITTPSFVFTPVSTRLPTTTTIDTYGNWFITATDSTGVSSLGTPFDLDHPFYRVGQPGSLVDPDKPPGNVFNINAVINNASTAFNVFDSAIYSNSTSTHGHYAGQFTGFIGASSSGAGGCGFNIFNENAAGGGHAIVAGVASKVAISGGDLGGVEIIAGQHGATPRAVNYGVSVASKTTGCSFDKAFRVDGTNSITSTGTILGLRAATRVNCAWGIDFLPSAGVTDATFSGGAFRSTGFTVDGTGRTLITAGTSGSPSLRFGADTASGFYQSSANSIVVRISSADELLINNNGVALASTTSTQVFTTGSGTWTRPSSRVKWIKVRGIGAGGGGGGSGTGAPGTGGTGGNTTFSTLTGNGGVGGAPSTGSPAAGGTATGGDVNITGASGGAGAFISGTFSYGGSGAPSFFGGAPGITSTSGNAGAAASSPGTGGSGATAAANTSWGNGGGAGGYFEKIIAAPASTLSYAVGAGGTAGTAGTGGQAGGAGAAGIIIVEEYYI